MRPSMRLSSSATSPSQPLPSHLSSFQSTVITSAHHSVVPITLELRIPDEATKSSPGHPQACVPFATGLLHPKQEPTELTSTPMTSLVRPEEESVTKAARPLLELESTLLTYSSPGEFLDEPEPGRSFWENDMNTDDDEDPGLSNCNSKATDADGATEMIGVDSLDRLIYRCSTLEIFRRAVGLAAHHSRFFARRLTIKRRTSATPLTPLRLAAQLNLLVLRMNDFVDKLQTSVKIEISAEERKMAVLWCLHTFGFQLRQARLQPSASMFHKLEDHEFWIISPSPALLGTNQPYPYEPQEWLMVIDFNFTELFSVVRPTKSFAHFFDKLRREFVGTALRDLPDAIDWIGQEANGSLKNRLISIAPWRQSSFLKTCFTRGLDQASRDAVYQFEDVPEMAKDIVLRFIRINPRLLDAIGFELKGDAARPLGMSVSSSISFEKHPFTNQEAIGSAAGFRPSGLSNLFGNMSI